MKKKNHHREHRDKDALKNLCVLCVLVSYYRQQWNLSATHGMVKNALL